MPIANQVIWVEQKCSTRKCFVEVSTGSQKPRINNILLGLIKRQKISKKY